MLNHGFWNFSPTAVSDFSTANGGRVVEMRARDRDWNPVPIEYVKRFRAPQESVLYALIRKDEAVPERVPTQSRFLE
jgi:hypothetical protein